MIFALSISSIAKAADTSCWIAPTQLENGTALAASDIGGFELTYQKPSDTAAKKVVISNGAATCYTFTDFDSTITYTVQVAAFTKSGLYSNLVSLTYKSASPPKPPTGFKINQKVFDVVAACLAAAPNCRIAVAGEWQ